MNVMWSYFWPAFAIGLVIGAIAGSIAFRSRIVRPKDRLAGDTLAFEHDQRRRKLALAGGFAGVLAAGALWHGPLGAADRLTNRVERDARATLDFYLPQVSAKLQRQPLTRQLVLTGPANDFQRTELVRTMETLPGVRRATWSAGSRGLPLIGEGLLVAFAGFLLGLVLAYLVELRRRYNAQWNW